jgi:putative hydrolase
MEISSFHRGTDEAYVRAAARQGADFVLSSDAHSPARVGDLDAALRVARRAGLSPERVMNAAGV